MSGVKGSTSRRCRSTSVIVPTLSLATEAPLLQPSCSLICTSFSYNICFFINNELQLLLPKTHIKKHVHATTKIKTKSSWRVVLFRLLLFWSLQQRHRCVHWLLQMFFYKKNDVLKCVRFPTFHLHCKVTVGCPGLTGVNVCPLGHGGHCSAGGKQRTF